MKKNKAMRAAGGVLIATLLSTSAVSGTFAKYVSKGSAGDTARVAKWGVVITGGGNLFSKNYLNGTTNTPTISTTPSEISVESNNRVLAATAVEDKDEVVAPGTKNDAGLSFSLTGKPEVDTMISAEVNAKDIYLKSGKTYALMKKAAVTENNFAAKSASGIFTEDGGAYKKVASTATYSSSTQYYELDDFTNVEVTADYYPIVFSYKGNSSATATSGTANTVANTVAAALNGEAVTGNKDSDTGVTTYTVTGKAYQSNVDLSSININDANITWEWAYEDSVAANVDSTDAKDTILGDLAAKYIDGKNGTSEFDGDIVTVTKNGTTVDSVTVLTIDNNGLVKEGTSEVGCIMVQFDIDITATQID